MTKTSTIPVYMVYCFLLFVCSHANVKVQDCNSNYHSIKGEIRLHDISEQGNLYVLLITEEIFKIPMKSFRKRVIKIGEKETKAKKVCFEFDGLPPNDYGIRCYLDTNRDAKLNKGMFGPSEPWGMSWQDKKPMRWPKFSDIVFTVKTDVSHLVIELE